MTIKELQEVMPLFRVVEIDEWKVTYRIRKYAGRNKDIPNEYLDKKVIQTLLEDGRTTIFYAQESESENAN